MSYQDAIAPAWASRSHIIGLPQSRSGAGLRQWPRRSAVILMWVFLLAATGCAAKDDGVVCSGSAHNVHRSSGTPFDMVGKATGSCSGVVSVEGYVEIQRRNSSGSWVAQKRTTIEEFNTVPGKEFTQQAATQCRTGVFRTKSYIRGTYKGESQAATRYSGSTTNPCG